MYLFGIGVDARRAGQPGKGGVSLWRGWEAGRPQRALAT